MYSIEYSTVFVGKCNKVLKHLEPKNANLFSWVHLWFPRHISVIGWRRKHYVSKTILKHYRLTSERKRNVHLIGLIWRNGVVIASEQQISLFTNESETKSNERKEKRHGGKMNISFCFLCTTFTAQIYSEEKWHQKHRNRNKMQTFREAIHRINKLFSKIARPSYLCLMPDMENSIKNK